MKLIDRLAQDCDCYLSDLKYTFTFDELKSVLLKYQVRDYTIAEWKELLAYIYEVEFDDYDKIIEFLRK